MRAAIRRAVVDSDNAFVATCLVLPLAGLAIFFIYPLMTMVARSLTEPDGAVGFGNYARILQTPSFWLATAHSLIMSAATTALAVLCGLVVAFSVHRCKIPGRSLLVWAVALPLLAPSLVQGLGLIFLLGRNGLIAKATGLEFNIYGFWGLLIANTLYALPEAVLIIGAALRTADARVYEAAELLGASQWRQFIDITLPNIKFGLLSAAFVVFTVTITDFGNAATIGGDYSVLATEIYNQAVGQMNFNLGAVIGIMLLLPTVLAFYLERVAGQRQFGAIERFDRAFEPVVDAASGYSDGAGLLAGGAAADDHDRHRGVRKLRLAVAVPLRPHAQALRREGGRRLRAIVDDRAGLADRRAGRRCRVVRIGLRARAGAARSWQSRSISSACCRPRCPGWCSALPISSPSMRRATPLYALYGSAALLAICNAVHYSTQGFLTTMTGLRQVPATLAETATCLGAGVPLVMRDVVGPFVAPTIVSVFFFLFMRSMVTLSAVIFLVTASVSVASVSIMRLEEAGFTSQAAAYATCTMAVVVAASVVMQGCLWLTGRRAGGGEHR